jgi:hypothetical protein
VNEADERTNARRTEWRTKFAAKNNLRRLYFDAGNPTHQRARSLRRRVNGAFGNDRNAGDLLIGTSGGTRPASTQEGTE